ncbi:MAG TPA: nuclear transport factor 2 family protein [Acidimicrobiia bacterium]|jgi:ketosteroid isomerase-like protein
MYKWAVRQQVRRNIEALGRGDLAPLLRGYSDDAVLIFPGESSWSGEHRGRTAIERFLRRFIAAGLIGHAEDILVNGPPWRTRIAVVFTDRAVDPEGSELYSNRAVLYAVARWGKITRQEDFEDTHKVEAFDRWLDEHGIAPR